jgi:chromosome segregation ATPase
VNALLQQLFAPLTFSCALIVFSMGVLLIVLMGITTRTARRQLLELQWPSPTPTAESPEAAMIRAELRQLSDGRALLAERPARILDEWLQHSVLRLARYEAGSWITGTALIFTFFLIAWVLANDVGPAISHTGAQSMQSLASAVRNMGAKFVVSMIGITMSIAHGLSRTLCVRLLHECAAEAGHRMLGTTVSLLDYQIECAERQAASSKQHADYAEKQLTIARKTAECADETLQHTAAIHAAVKQQHGETTARLASLTESITKLQSIEVSVKDIGTELSRSLQQTVKKDIVEGITRELQDIADGLQRALTESFTTSLGSQIGLITEELHKIEQAVASQAHSQVEDLLHKLSDAVSGGFATESSRMKDALTRFAEVVPALETQMRALSRSATDDLAHRSAESERSSALMLERMGSLLEGIAQQQESAAQASAQMQDLVAQAHGGLATSLATANEELSARSQNAVNQLTSAMHAATHGAADVYRSLVGEIQQAAQMLREARGDTTQGATQLRESSNVLRESLARISEQMNTLRELSGTLNSSLHNARTTVDTSSAALQSSADALAQHQRVVQDLAQRWPTMASQYLQLTDEAFQKVSTAWKSQADSIKDSVGKIGDAFAGSSTEFADAVSDLGTQLERMRGGVPPATRRG